MEATEGIGEWGEERAGPSGEVRKRRELYSAETKWHKLTSELLAQH